MLQETATQSPNKPHLERKIREGKTLQDFARELDRTEKLKKDFNVPINLLRAEVTEQNKVAIAFDSNSQHQYSLSNWAGSQVSQFLDIPRRYYKKLNDENPELLAKNINHGFEKIDRTTDAKSRLVRTLDGNVRGFLSNKYRMLDSFDLMQTIMPMLLDHDFEVVSCDLTEKRLYLKTATPKIQGEVKKDDIVSYGVMVSTSDVGAGSLKVEPFYLRLWCLNGAVSTSTFKKAHLGRSNAEGELQEMLTDDTKRLNDQAFFATVRDYMSHTMRPEIFNAELLKMQDAATRKINNFDLSHVVDVTMKTVGVTGDNVKQGILEALASGNQNAGLTQWGLMNSFTTAAKLDTIDYDTATDLERAGGLILNLNKTQWTRIAEVQH